MHVSSVCAVQYTMCVCVVQFQAISSDTKGSFKSSNNLLALPRGDVFASVFLFVTKVTQNVVNGFQ